MSKPRAAVIGAGYFGRLHAKKLAANRNVELIAVADPIAERAQAVAAEFSCGAARDVRELIGRIDLATVAVPTPAHYEVGRALLEAGVHALIEKPLARTLAQADELIRIARSNRLVLAAGHQERFNPAFVALRKSMTRALYIEAERLAPFKARGGEIDVVLDLMIHDLDLALALAGEEPATVAACGFRGIIDAVDIANARLEFANGCVANLSASRVSQSPVRKLRVFQPDSYVSADLHAARLRAVHKAPHAPFGVAETESAFEDVDPLGAEIEAFVAAARGIRALPVGIEEVRRTLKVALQVSELVAEWLERVAEAGEARPA